MLWSGNDSVSRTLNLSVKGIHEKDLQLDSVKKKEVISIFLRVIVLQTDSPTECIDNPTFRVDSPTKPILEFFSPTNRWSYSTVGQSIH